MFTRTLRLITTTCVVGAMSLGLTACKMHSSAPSAADKAAMMMGKPDIIDTATGPNMEQVTTVVKAIEAADLVSALKAPGPFTVFAPTNDAFNKLPAGTVDDLLKPENKDKLRSILLYHVHAGDAILAGEAKTMDLSTLNGKTLSISVSGSTVMVNNATVVKADIICSNGVIHWIDTVLMP